MTHTHDFKLIDTLHRRYRCECGVYGFRLGRRPVQPFTCRLELDNRKTCCKPAVFVSGQQSQSRCAEHVEAERRTA